MQIALSGQLGESDNVGGASEKTNLEVVRRICQLMDEMVPDAAPHERLIVHVVDRPGHDRRYAIDAGKIKRDLGWEARETFDTGLRKTVRWYLDNAQWWKRIRSGLYRGERLGALT